MFLVIVRQYSHIHILERLIVTLNHLPTTLQHTFISVHLNQTDGSHNICHITLIPSTDNVILPSAQFSLSQGILVLTMQAQQLSLAIQVFVPGLPLNFRYTAEGIFRILIQILHHLLITERKIPRQGTALSCGEVLDSMETE